MLGAIEEIISTPDVDAEVSAEAADELAEEPEVPEDPADEEHDTADGVAEADDAEGDADTEVEEDTEAEEGTEAEEKARATGDTVVLGGDEDFWLQVGIDPVRIMTGSGTFYTLRCYLDDRPIFLGRNGRISVFTSERALARYLADEHDHDLSDVSTYDDIRTAATDGSLAVDITDDNIYVLSGLADDFADGPDAVDREQLDLAVELLRDIGDYSEESTVDKALETERPLGNWWPTSWSETRARSPTSPRPRIPRWYGNGRSWSSSWIRGCGANRTDDVIAGRIR